LNHAENFKIKNIFSRTAAFIFYFTAAGFTGAICRVILNPFLQIMLRNQPGAKNIILYLISLCVIIAVLCFFSMREGFTDTQNLRFSVFKTFICYFASGIIFFIIITCADIFIFGENNFFKEYFLSPYFAHEYFNGYFIPAVFILINAGVMLPAYKAGRNIWIKRKQKLLSNTSKTKKL